MEEYKPNSHKSKIVNDGEIPEKKVNPVISGQAKIKKKSGFRKVADSLIAGDAATVREYIFKDVIIPSVKKTISDVITNSLDMFLYGEKRGAQKTGASKISYRAYYEGKRAEPADRSSRYKDDFDYDDIVFDSWGAADSVLSGMYDVLEAYNVVSIGDFYELANIPTTNFNINKYGWTNLSGSEVMRVHEGYMIKFATRATPIS